MDDLGSDLLTNYYQGPDSSKVSLSKRAPAKPAQTSTSKIPVLVFNQVIRFPKETAGKMSLEIKPDLGESRKFDKTLSCNSDKTEINYAKIQAVFTRKNGRVV